MFIIYRTGHIIFQLRQRSSDSKKKPKRPRAVSQEDLRSHGNDQRHTNLDMLPYLIELNVRGEVLGNKFLLKLFTSTVWIFATGNFLDKNV